MPTSISKWQKSQDETKTKILKHFTHTDHALFQHPVNFLLHFWRRGCASFLCVYRQKVVALSLSLIDYSFWRFSSPWKSLGNSCLKLGVLMLSAINACHQSQSCAGRMAEKATVLVCQYKYHLRLLYPCGRMWRWRHPGHWEEYYLVLEEISLQVWLSLLSPCFLPPPWLRLQYQVWS